MPAPLSSPGLAEWVADAPRWALTAVGFRTDPSGKTVTVPRPTAVTRLLSHLDGDAFEPHFSQVMSADRAGSRPVDCVQEVTGKGARR